MDYRAGELNMWAQRGALKERGRTKVSEKIGEFSDGKERFRRPGSVTLVSLCFVG